MTGLGGMEIIKNFMKTKAWKALSGYVENQLNNNVDIQQIKSELMNKTKSYLRDNFNIDLDKPSNGLLNKALTDLNLSSDDLKSIAQGNTDVLEQKMTQRLQQELNTRTGMTPEQIQQNYYSLRRNFGILSYTTVGSTTWVAPLNVTQVQYLVVGGGGGAGNGYDNAGGGGGGAGMVLTGNIAVTPGTSYTVTVGAGGAGGADARTNNPGNTGNSSVFSSVTSLGGGAGAGSRTGGTAGAAQVGSTTAATGGSL